MNPQQASHPDQSVAYRVSRRSAPNFYILAGTGLIGHPVDLIRYLASWFDAKACQNLLKQCLRPGQEACGRHARLGAAL